MRDVRLLCLLRLQTRIICRPIVVADRKRSNLLLHNLLVYDLSVVASMSRMHNLGWLLLRLLNIVADQGMDLTLMVALWLTRRHLLLFLVQQEHLLVVTQRHAPVLSQVLVHAFGQTPTVHGGCLSIRH